MALAVGKEAKAMLGRIPGKIAAIACSRTKSSRTFDADRDR